MWTTFLVFIEFITTVVSVLCFQFFYHKACGILVPQPGIKPTLPVLEGEVSTTGSPGKSLKGTFVLRQQTVDLTPLCPLPSSLHETSRWQWSSGVVWISSSRWTLMRPYRSLKRRPSVSWSPRPHSICPSRILVQSDRSSGTSLTNLKVKTVLFWSLE